MKQEWLERHDELFQVNRKFREEALDDASHKSSEAVGHMWKDYYDLRVQPNEKREHLFKAHLQSE